MIASIWSSVSALENTWDQKTKAETPWSWPCWFVSCSSGRTGENSVSRMMTRMHLYVLHVVTGAASALPGSFCASRNEIRLCRSCHRRPGRTICRLRPTGEEGGRAQNERNVRPGTDISFPGIETTRRSLIRLDNG